MLVLDLYAEHMHRQLRRCVTPQLPGLTCINCFLCRPVHAHLCWHEVVCKHSSLIQRSGSWSLRSPHLIIVLRGAFGPPYSISSLSFYLDVSRRKIQLDWVTAAKQSMTELVYMSCGLLPSIRRCVSGLPAGAMGSGCPTSRVGIPAHTNTTLVQNRS